MNSELTRCPVCKRPLVGQEVVHAVRGTLYCSKNCAVQDIMNDYIANAKEMAIEAYACEAEIVATEEVLNEDLQKVTLTVTCTKTIKLPKNLAETDAIMVATKLYNDGLVGVEPDDCDEVTFACALVKDENSEHEED